MVFVNYLGNVFVGSLTGYMQSRAPIGIQTLYGIIFSLGVVPTALMILWTKFFSSRWLSRDGDRGLPDVEQTSEGNLATHQTNKQLMIIQGEPK